MSVGGTRQRVVQGALFPGPDGQEPGEAATPRPTTSPELVSYPPPALGRFDRLAAVVTTRPPRGVSLRDLSAIGALCRELDREVPREDRLADLLADLELTEDDLAEALEASR